MDRVWVTTLAGGRFYFDIKSAQQIWVDDKEGPSEALYHTLHGHWVFWEWNDGYKEYKEFTQDQALEFFIRHNISVPASLESLSLLRDLDMSDLRNRPQVETWPETAGDDEPVICRTADGRWILDNPAFGRERYTELSTENALRYILRKGWKLPRECEDEDWPWWWEELPDSLVQAVRSAVALKRRKSVPALSRPPAVQLKGTNQPPVVQGRKKSRPLPNAQYNVVKAILDAGGYVSSGELLSEGSGHTDAVALSKPYAAARSMIL